MTTPTEQISNLVIGTVETVSSNEISILMDLDTPHTTAINTGTPTAFPRLNSYVLIPNEAGATVAYISWIGIERSPYPKRSMSKDFGLIDLPFPLRKMSVSPVGTLTSRRERSSGTIKYELSRGINAFPSVGDQVLIPTPEQIEAIVGAKDADKRVRIGSSPMATSAAISVDPDKIFGRHLAVLGNTGSGKSCTVAGLIRWSIEAAEKAIPKTDPAKTPNARFIVLDPNGEYARAFADQGAKLRLFRVPPVSAGERPLDVPAWMWNGHEWTAVAHAQPGAQRPLLLQGLRELKSGRTAGVPREAIIRSYLVSYSTRISAMLNTGTQTFAGSNPARFACAGILGTIVTDCRALADSVVDPIKASLVNIATITDQTITRRRGNAGYFNDFAIADLEGVRDAINTLASTLPDTLRTSPVSEDAPIPFDVDTLADHLERVATEQGGNLAGFISTLGLRIRGMLADRHLGQVNRVEIEPENGIYFVEI